MDVAITGAGIAGLSAAISLRRSGHKVTIYERSSFNNEVGAAINVPPNVARFLLPSWGIDAKSFVKSTGGYFISPTTLDVLMSTDYSQNEYKFGAPLYYAHRVDLHEGLKEIAFSSDGPGIPVTIRLKSAVESYDSEVPSVTLTDGTVIKADLVIAADGIHSMAVDSILGKTKPPEPAKHSNCCYRFLISKADLEADPDTRSFCQSSQRLGIALYPDHASGRRLVTYACRNHEIYNFAAICNNSNMNSKKEDWQASVPKTEVLEIFAGYHPSLLALINKATDVKRWPLLYRPPIPTWHRGSMALAGDAAHPMLPHQGQGGAQGIEDGLVVGLVLHGVTDPAKVPERLALYQKIRRNRAASIQILSNFGMDEDVPSELNEFLEGKPAPTTMSEIVHLSYSADVIQDTYDEMKKFDPLYELPKGYSFVDRKPPPRTSL